MPRIAKTKVVKPKKTKKVEPYTASIKLFGKIYSATGLTIQEAIGNIPASKVAKGASVLTVSKGGNSHSKILNGRQVVSLFTPSKMMREIALKRASALFNL